MAPISAAPVVRLTLSDRPSPMAAGRKRRQRRGEPRPGGATLVLRGDLLEPDVLRDSAIDNHEVYGFYGVSVFVEAEDISWRDIAALKLARAEWIVLFEAGALLAAGVELWDTGQSPHYDLVHDDIDELVARILGCQHRVVPNPARTGELP
jgi:hypothetical protein